MSDRLMRVETENSTYEINERSGVVTRFPDKRSLRRDGEALPYRAIGEPEVGKPLKMVLILRPDMIPTYRATSLVTRVEVACAWCDQYVMDEQACFNAKDICVECCSGVVDCGC